MSYRTISGTVSELQVYSATYDLGFTSDEGGIAGGAAILAAATGNAVNAAALSGTGVDVAMERFVCKVGEYTVHGMFHKVGFVEGDVIDFAVQPDEEGRLIVSAARNPAMRYIWVEPYKTRGNRAQLRHDVFWGILMSVAPAVAATAFIYRDLSSSPEGTFIITSTGLGVLGIASVMNYLIRRRFFPPSLKATEIFKALGYSNPASVDLVKGLDDAEKQWTQKSGQKTEPIVPWRYRY